jgi:peptide/nickel transport system ATP-binding protein/oligopeptide transport system ATP-binding protein
MSAIPIPDPTLKRERIVLTGDVPSPLNPPAGCRFHPRCAKMIDGTCNVDLPPELEPVPGHFIACWLYA